MVKREVGPLPPSRVRLGGDRGLAANLWVRLGAGDGEKVAIKTGNMFLKEVERKDVVLSDRHRGARRVWTRSSKCVNSHK